MEIKSDIEVLEYISKILKTKIEDLEAFDSKLNDAEEIISNNELENANFIIESTSIDLINNLNRGLLENLSEILKGIDIIADVFVELDNRLSNGVDI